MKLLHQIYLVIFIFQCFLRLNSFEFPYTSTIQKHFQKQFIDTCSKYPFVQQWVNKLEYPGHRQVMFVFDEPGLNNGGFGDRLAGLLGAIGLALRFNRTLVLRDSRGLANYFRPYHPVDIHSPVPKYTWDKYLQWSNYNVSLANNDATEYDLYYCINNGNTKSAACSMEGSDVSQPIILLRSNRAYFCRYEKYPDTAAFHEMTNVLGLNNTSNLYEAAGCMLRLALWPTRSLWIDADRSYYDDLYARLLSNQQIPSFNDKDESHRKKRYLRKENSKKDDLNSSDHRSLLSFEIVDERDDDYTSPTASSSTKTNDETSFNYFHQIGIHFRCGDHSYSGAHDAWDCEYDPNHPSNNIYMLQGNPYFLATCGKEVLHNYTLSLIQSHSMVATDAEIQMNQSHNFTDVWKNHFLMYYISSDNALSSNQIIRTTNYNFSLLSPPGCHLEHDRSWDCFSVTTKYWFMMSLSQVIIVQEVAESTIYPVSSYSRYAGIYGLQNVPFISGKTCLKLDTMHLSYHHHNNWYC